MFMLTIVNVYVDSGECLYHPDWFGGAGGECLC